MRFRKSLAAVQKSEGLRRVSGWGGQSWPEKRRELRDLQEVGQTGHED